MSCERALFYRQICEQCRAGQVWQNTSEVKEVRGRRHRSVKWNRSAAPPPPPLSAPSGHILILPPLQEGLSAPLKFIISLRSVLLPSLTFCHWSCRLFASRVALPFLLFPRTFYPLRFWCDLTISSPRFSLKWRRADFFFFSSILSCTQWARRRFTLCTKASWIVCASACQWVSLCASNRGLDLKPGSAHLWSGRSTTCSCAHAEASDINNSCRMWMEIEPWRLQIGSDVTSY